MRTQVEDEMARAGDVTPGYINIFFLMFFYCFYVIKKYVFLIAMACAGNVAAGFEAMRDGLCGGWGRGQLRGQLQFGKEELDTVGVGMEQMEEEVEVVAGEGRECVSGGQDGGEDAVGTGWSGRGTKRSDVQVGDGVEGGVGETEEEEEERLLRMALERDRQRVEVCVCGVWVWVLVCVWGGGGVCVCVYICAVCVCVCACLCSRYVRTNE
jgi:hypothetical protein